MIDKVLYVSKTAYDSFNKSKRSIEKKVTSFIVSRLVTTIDDFAKRQDSLVDAILIEHINKNEIFAGGTFYIEIVSNDKFKYGYEMYFTNENDEFIKVTNESDNVVDIDILTQESQKELLDNRRIEFDIDGIDD